MNRKHRPRSHEEVLVRCLVLPRVPPLLEPDREALHERTHNRPNLLEREALAHTIHWPVREREEREVVVHELRTDLWS